MSELSNLCDETGEKEMDQMKVEEYLEHNSFIQNDYKKMKQENEYYRQELYDLRRKLKASEALEKELIETNEALEQSLAQRIIKTEKVLFEREEKHKAERKEYENLIANLETNVAQSAQEVDKLHEELRKCKDFKNTKSHNLSSTKDNLIPYKEKIEELALLLQNERMKQEQLEEKLSSMKNQYEELQNILLVTKEQLEEKNVALENTREELAMNRMELESLKVTPANDMCKGNSLFAEVEDRRQMLLDKMKILHNKYKEAKLMLNAKTNEIKLLKVKKTAMERKWETDVIETLQENTDLLNKYKSRALELENKLKTEMRKNSQISDVQSDGDSFNYAVKLLETKKKEFQQLNEKLLWQSREILMREEENHDISKQLRYWRSKAVSLEAQILTIKAQLESKRANDDNDNDLLEAIENCTMNDNVDFEKTCDLEAISGISDNNTHVRKL